MALFVGTSGWAYKEWKPDFYPADLPQKRFLEHYGSILGACEINATFYRRQAPTTFAKWAGATSHDFRFATKAHRALTHARQMKIEGDRKTFLGDFMTDVSLLGDKLGAILFQFPKHRERSDEDLSSFIAALGDEPPFVLEFRNDSWAGPEVEEMVAAAGGTICVSETEGEAPKPLPPGPLAYIRLRGQRYSPEAKQAWAELLAEEAESRDVFAFTKHEGIPTADDSGGIGLARWLTERSPAAS